MLARELTVWGWLLSHFVPDPERVVVPPVQPAPTVETTTTEEKRRIDQRLKDHEARLARLQALAGLDQLRARDATRGQ